MDQKATSIPLKTPEKIDFRGFFVGGVTGIGPSSIGSS